MLLPVFLSSFFNEALYRELRSVTPLTRAREQPGIWKKPERAGRGCFVRLITEEIARNKQKKGREKLHANGARAAKGIRGEKGFSLRCGTKGCGRRGGGGDLRARKPGIRITGATKKVVSGN